jgi:transcriptional regulator
MHAPPHFRVDDPARLWAAVAEWGFATVFSADGDGHPYATLAPFVVRDERLWGHFARGNPQWRSFDPERRILCQFVGAHAYVSPSLYSTAGQVPTWNFAQVQVRGVPRMLEGDEARFVVEETVREFEGRRPAAVGPEWMAGTVDQLLRGIAAFEVVSPELEGSWKLSQNKPEADRARVAEELSEGGAGEQAVAHLMREDLGRANR